MTCNEPFGFFVVSIIDIHPAGQMRRGHQQRRKWFSRKYYTSVMHLKEFHEKN